MEFLGGETYGGAWAARGYLVTCAAVEQQQQQRWVPWAPPPVSGQSTPVRTSVRPPVGQRGTKKESGSWRKTNNNAVRL